MNMIKKLALLLLMMPFMASAQTAREFFLSAPMELLGYIDETSRLDMVDYLEAGLKDRSVKTYRDVDARLVQLTDSSFTVEVGEVLTIKAQTLQAKSDTVIALIETLATPAPDSKLTIYNKVWKPLPKAWTAPADKAWGKHPAKFLLTEYSLQGNTLILSDRTAQWNADIAPQTKQLTFKWDPKAGKFK